MSVCQYCHKVISPTAKFCPACGKTVIANLIKCSQCRNPLKPGALFCPKCGETVPKTCPSCDAVLKPWAKFCTNCGKNVPNEFWSSANICTSCGANLKANAKFCNSCGASVATPAKNTTFAENTPQTIVQNVQENANTLAQNRLSEENQSFAENHTTEPQTIAPPFQNTNFAQSSSFKATVQTDSINTPTRKKSRLSLMILGIIGVGVIAGGIVAATTLLEEKSELDSYFQDKFTYGKIVDVRDQQKYRTIKIGNQEWIAQNMNYDVPGSVCDSCELYGRYYTYEQASSVCPEGYKVPTVTDFMALQRYDAALLKSIKGWNADNAGIDSVGFASIPAGFVSFRENNIKRRGETSGFWTSLSDGYTAVRMKIEKNGAAGTVNALDPQYGFPVRCISSATSKTSGEDEVLLDGRNGSLLKSVTVGSQKWLAQNSDIKLPKSYCYDNDQENCNQYGRLYEWSSAIDACPEGTRLPNATDIAELKKNSNIVSKLDLKFGGFRNAKGGYEQKGSQANMWTASEVAANAKYWRASANGAGIIDNKVSKKAAMAIRCIVGELENEVKIGHFTDNRDNQTYAIVTVGKQTWMAQNLNYAISGSYCYNDDMDNCSKFGRLYTYSDAKEVCPENYHLPNDAEWQTLKNFLADNGNGKLATMSKSTSDWTNPGKDLYGLNIKPTGYRSEDGGYKRLDKRAHFWSETSTANIDSAYHWSFADDAEYLAKTSAYMQDANAVRCVRNQAIEIYSSPEHRTMSDRVAEKTVKTSSSEVFMQDDESFSNSTYRAAEKIANEALDQATKEYNKAVRNLDEETRRTLNKATNQAVNQAINETNRALQNATQDYNNAVRDANRMLNSFGF